MRGRGDLRMDLRLLLRGRGVAGVVGVVAGASAFAATYLDWYVVRAEVAMLGSDLAADVATLAGWEAHPWSWIPPAIAIIAIAASLSIAFDRSPPAAPRVQAAAGSALGIVAAIGAVVVPPVSRFDVAGTRLRDLIDVAGRLPRDVDLDFAASTAAGLWLMLGAAGLLVAVGVAGREG